MALANKPLNDITEADLQELIDNQVAEGKEYDYKVLVGNSDDDKREFLADVSSFANTVGGHLIIGMNEADGVPTGVAGLSGNIDAEKLRLEEILRNGIAPRMRFEIQPINTQTGRVLIIRIPRSWSVPHMVTFKNNSRFFARHSAGKYQLDVAELRSAFTLSEIATERIRNFRLDRIAKIAADETPIKLSAGAKLVLHIIPITAFTTTYSLSDLTPDNRIEWQYKLAVPITITNQRYNLDGLLFHGVDVNIKTSRREKYVQVFRNGAIEFTDTSVLNRVDSIIPYASYERTILTLLPILLSIQEELGVRAPVVVMLTLLGVKGYTLGESEKRSDGRAIAISSQTIEQNELLIPDTIIDDFNSNLSQQLKLVFDVVWQACGLPQSKNYDKEGYWNPQ